MWRVCKVLCTFKPVFQQLITITPFPLKVCLLNYFCLAHSLTGGDTKKNSIQKILVQYPTLHLPCWRPFKREARPSLLPWALHHHEHWTTYDKRKNLLLYNSSNSFKKSKIGVNTSKSLSGAAIFCLPDPALLSLREDACTFCFLFSTEIRMLHRAPHWSLSGKKWNCLCLLPLKSYLIKPKRK